MSPFWGWLSIANAILPWLIPVIADRFRHARVRFLVTNALQLTSIGCSAAIAIAAFNSNSWFGGGLWAFNCALLAYLWWNDDDNRKWRRKLKKRVSERIANLGGKLVVQPT